MKKVFLLISLFSVLGLFSQDLGMVKGNVIDLEANNEPILFANITIKNTALKTRTNLNGNFEIKDVTPGTYILEISFLGYETAEIPLEIKENEITEIHKGLVAKSISMLGLSASIDPKDQGEAFFANPD